MKNIRQVGLTATNCPEFGNFISTLTAATRGEGLMPKGQLILSKPITQSDISSAIRRDIEGALEMPLDTPLRGWTKYFSRRVNKPRSDYLYPTQSSLEVSIGQVSADDARRQMMLGVYKEFLRADLGTLATTMSCFEIYGRPFLVGEAEMDDPDPFLVPTHGLVERVTETDKDGDLVYESIFSIFALRKDPEIGDFSDLTVQQATRFNPNCARPEIVLELYEPDLLQQPDILISASERLGKIALLK